MNNLNFFPSGMQSTFPSYIAVEGPIAAGKTTLVKRLVEMLNGRASFEVFESNPFLAEFYQDKTRFAFQTETFFLLSRFKQQEAFQQASLFGGPLIADYMFMKSRIFASLTLSDHELAMFDKIFDILSPQIPKPDLVIFLDAPVETLLERIAKRGRAYEQKIEVEYLQSLSRLYRQFFKHYDRSPVITIDSSVRDSVADPTEVDRIIDDVRSVWQAHFSRRD